MICECGCGRETTVYRGVSRRFINGHHRRGSESKFKGHRHTAKTKKKISEICKGYKHTDEALSRMSGENNHNWRGGISFEPYCHKFNEQFKEMIRDKFGRVCFLCGKTEEGNSIKLSVHHVQYNKNCGCDDSLKCDYVPLCNSCHSKTTNNREYYESLILEKLLRTN